MLDHLKKFDFSIFKYKTLVQLVSGHASTIFHTRRFGTASFPDRPAVEAPPEQLHELREHDVHEPNGPAHVGALLHHLARRPAADHHVGVAQVHEELVDVVRDEGVVAVGEQPLDVLPVVLLLHGEQRERADRAQSAKKRRIKISLADSARAALVNVAQNVLVSGNEAKRWGKNYSENENHN